MGGKEGRYSMSVTSSGSWGLEKCTQGIRKSEAKANKKHEHDFLSFCKSPMTAVFIPVLLSVLLFIGHTWSGKLGFPQANLLARGRVGQHLNAAVWSRVMGW